ncbi:glycoside hydrolase superfamily [Aspergillus floccosus]
MGFTAVWITPIAKQLPQTTSEGTGYHGYWQQDMYTHDDRYDVDEHLGTADDVKALSKALHDRGMYLMLDVVANHMGYNGPRGSTDFSIFNPFNSASYFHSYCQISNYNDQTQVENCWLGDDIVSLTDIYTQKAEARAIWYGLVKDLVSNYTVDGLRLDTVKHVEKDFWQGYSQAAGVYTVGEVLHGDPAYTCPYQGYMDGVMNYPIYFQLREAFKSSSGSITNLVNMINLVSSSCRDPTLLGSFIENHDNARFPSFTSDMSRAKSVIAYVFFADGIPIIYAGQEQHYAGGENPYNREALWLSGYPVDSELYKFISTANKIRKLAISKDSNYLTSRNNAFYTNTNTIAMRKGSGGSQVITVLSNSGSNGGSYTLDLYNHGYSSGAALVELYTCSSVQVGSNGNIPVPMASGLPRVFVPAAWITGSGLCGSSSSTTLTTTTRTTTSSSSGSSTSACVSATTLPVTFSEKVTTSFGENIFLIGSIPQLGNWNTGNAVPLSASGYTVTNPVWSVTVNLPVGTSFQYKYLRKKQDGSVVWESDPNRSYTVQSSCTEVESRVSDSWR